LLAVFASLFLPGLELLRITQQFLEALLFRLLLLAV